MPQGHPYIVRQLEGRLETLFQHFPVVVVSGARQVGKSTLLEHCFPKLPRVVFDPVIDIENARQDPDLFLANRKPPVILDEVQYVPELAGAIKRLLEKNRLPGQYLLTGSQQWSVMKVLSESLAGRAAFLDLEGFNLPEIGGIPQKGWLPKWLEQKDEEHPSFDRVILKRSLFEQLWRGFLPEAQFLPLSLLPDFHGAYQRTYVERDIRQMAEITDLQLFGRFFRLCGALTAQEINTSQLGRELGVTPQTASRWVGLLKATFQWFEIPAFSGNAVKKTSLKPKGYISDTGMTCFSQAISSPEAIAGHPLWGALFETAVIGEIRKQCRLLGTAPVLYHWRSHSGAEADLILEWNGKVFPVEIKAKSNPGRADLRGLNAFRKTYPHLNIQPGLVLAPVERFFQLSDRDYCMPWDAL
ncbi:MAG: ATP-binding protein [Deltaproteobacteria bacterium]|nr:ATP-binding protein [Deltaproteobacteria bacterium]